MPTSTAPYIATLLMTFFFRRMRPVIEQGHFFLASPPLYKCKNGKHEEYCWNDMRYSSSSPNTANEPKIQRYKGPGEMSDEELRYTTMSPEHRILKQVHISDAARPTAYSPCSWARTWVRDATS